MARANALQRSVWPCLRAHGPIAAILLVALLVRLAGLDFGLPALLDPDELMFELGAFKMLNSGTMNPGWFGHPATTTMYVLSLVMVGSFVVGAVTGRYEGLEQFVEAIFNDPSILIYPGRVIMVLFAILTVWLTYRLAQRLFDRPTAMIAALLVAISPVHVSWSQVIRTDIMATCALVGVMVLSGRYLQQGKRRDMVLAAIVCGVAIATKWPFAVAIISVFGAIAGRWLWHGEAIPRSLRDAVMVLAICVVSLLATSPYLVIEYPTVLANLQGEARPTHLGATGSGFFGNIGFYLSGPLLLALGLPGLVAAAAGAITGTKIKPYWLIVGLPALVLFAVMSSQNLTWERWAVPLIPALAIPAGYLLSRICREIFAKTNAVAAAAIAVAGAALVFGPLVGTGLARYNERVHDTRKLATDWASTNLPAGSTVIIEHFAFDLQSTELEILFPIGEAGCLNARDLLSGRIDYRFIEGLRNGNANLDLAAVPEAQVASCLKADFAIITEYDRYLAENSRYPEQVARYERLLQGSTILKRITARPGEIGGRPSAMVVKLAHPAIPEVQRNARNAPL